MSDEREPVTIELTLTRDEWCEVVNAVDTKSNRIRRGDYGEEENAGDDARWIATLESAKKTRAEALDEKGVVW
jgi:hypothetical protein